jgi:tRNA threonylcarbamoyladenosine biosynthesis protein TsaB
MRVLALDAALAGCSVAIVVDGAVVAMQAAANARGAAAALPGMVRGAMDAASGTPDMIAASVGPGSFTGIRAALSVAHGLALGFGLPLVGVSVAEAMAEMAGDLGRPLWVVLDNRRGRVFLDRAGALSAVAMDALPSPSGPVAIAGDAADAVAARLAARGWDVLLTAIRQVDAAAIARVAVRRLRGELPALAAVPLYVDPPEARPAAGLRPAPV